MYKKRNYKGKRPYKKRAYKRKTKSGNGLVTKTQLYKAISKNIETKQVTLEYPYTSFNGGISSNAEMYSLLPACSQGTGSNQKIGDQIRPKRLEIRGFVNYRSNENLNANCIIANLFMFQPKDIRHVGLNGNVSTDILTNAVSPLHCGRRHHPGEQCVSAPTYQGAARGQLLGELWVVFSFGVKFTSLIKVIYFLVNKVFLDQFRLFFDNSFIRLLAP